MNWGWGGLSGRGDGDKSIPGILVWQVWQPQIIEIGKRKKKKKRKIK
jgi:hypothetical protein